MSSIVFNNASGVIHCNTLKAEHKILVGGDIQSLHGDPIRLVGDVVVVGAFETLSPIVMSTLTVVGTLTAEDQMISTVATGTAPLTIASTTLVPNLYVEKAVLADTVTTNANLTGPISSIGNATSVTAQTGTGSTFVMDTSPILVTPNIGVATGTSLQLSGLTTFQVAVTDGTKTLASIPYGPTNVATAIVQRDGSGSCTVNELFSTAIQVAGLTPSQAVVTDGASNLISLAYASTNTASALVQRDGSGNFAAQAISATGLNVSGLSTFQTVGTDGSKNLVSVAYGSTNGANTLVRRDGSGAFTTAGITVTGTLTNSFVTVSTQTSDFVISGVTPNVFLVDATTGIVACTLPTSAPNLHYTIKKIDVSGNAVSVVPASGNIDGAPSLTFAAQWDTAEIVCDGVNWFIVSFI